MFGDFEDQFAKVFGDVKAKEKTPIKEPDTEKR